MPTPLPPPSRTTGAIETTPHFLPDLQVQKAGGVVSLPILPGSSDAGSGRITRGSLRLRVWHLVWMRGDERSQGLDVRLNLCEVCSVKCEV